MEKAICRANLFPVTCKYDHSVNRAGSVGVLLGNRGGFGLKKKFSSLSLKPQSLKSKFYGNRIVLGNSERDIDRRSQDSVKTQAALRIGTVQKWWEKGLQPNMKEITSAQDLVDSLSNAGDKLVVVDFFSPGCGGCKALHPKMCQLAEMNPEVEFLQVNYEEHKSMCYSLGVHVLPFFRFYRGAHGRLCSFSCTNATIKKFKDALAKHGSDRCSLGPTKGLEEKELLSVSANKDLNFTYTPVPTQPELVPANGEEVAEETKPAKPDPVRGFPFPLPSANNRDAEEKKALVASGR